MTRIDRSRDGIGNKKSFARSLAGVLDYRGVEN